MQPALSVLFFTVTSGVGYGLLIWMIIIQLLRGQLVSVNEILSYGLIGISLVTLGLLSSTLHLANPKNAWRSFSRFRTSWLSREGVFAVLFYPLSLCYALLVWLDEGQLTKLTYGVGLATALLALIIVICTGMIYASLKPIRQWHNPLTTPLYVLFSLMSGCLLYLLIDFALTGVLSVSLLVCFAAITLITAATKLAYFLLIGKPDGATINSATGFSQARVRLLDAGHNTDTFLTKEFVFDTDAVRLLNRRRTMAILVFFLPLIIVVLAYYWPATGISYLAFISLFSGLILERWLFFAEARHVVRLYHGDQRA